MPHPMYQKARAHTAVHIEHMRVAVVRQLCGQPQQAADAGVTVDGMHMGDARQRRGDVRQIRTDHKGDLRSGKGVAQTAQKA